MQKQQPVALVGAGKVAQSFIGRLTDLADHLGPVKSFSYRVASRIVNSIKAGRPVCDYADIEHCRLVLVCVPDELTATALADMTAAPLDWAGKAVVLCETWQDSAVLEPLAARGAFTASLNAVPGFYDRLFVTEGDGLALRDIKRLITSRSARIMRLRPSAKPVYMAGLAVAAYSAHLAAAGSDCLRAAGLPVAVSRPIIHALAADAVRSFVKAGRRSVGRPVTACDESRIREQCSALLRTNPDLADFYSTLSSALAGNAQPSTALPTT
jgi:predicted short-subunit dehydrogenase-like oxidoreductase (DUF2520 family)